MEKTKIKFEKEDGSKSRAIDGNPDADFDWTFIKGFVVGVLLTLIVLYLAF